MLVALILVTLASTFLFPTQRLQLVPPNRVRLALPQKVRDRLADLSRAGKHASSRNWGCCPCEETQPCPGVKRARVPAKKRLQEQSVPTADKSHVSAESQLSLHELVAESVMVLGRGMWRECQRERPKNTAKIGT